MKHEKMQTVTRDIVNEDRTLKRSLKEVQSDNTLLETSLDQLCCMKSYHPNWMWLINWQKLGRPCHRTKLGTCRRK